MVGHIGMFYVEITSLVFIANVVNVVPFLMHALVPT